jgi:S-adenosylmethionine:tRNA ribosyltransferase-isomerase
MKTADFDFNLPSELIALRPVPERDHARLLVIHRDGRTEHRIFSDIGGYLEYGDLLILNNTKVMPVRLIGSKPSGGKVDMILVKEKKGGVWEVLCRGHYAGPVSLRHSIEAELFYEDSRSAGGEKQRCLRFLNREAKDIDELLERCGSMPLPPYIKRLPDEEDRERYQTVYAEKTGSIAAPTAGLHFTDDLLNGLSEKGVKIRRLTLHVGPGTFTPIKAEDLQRHAMQSEYFEIAAPLLGEIAEVKKSGKRVVTVGTTATRALEGFLSKAYLAAGNGDGTVRGYTDIFIHPGYQFRGADALLTNFHLPRSTPLMLASAFCGFEKLMRAYEEAISMGYRFFSYGDAMLIL